MDQMCDVMRATEKYVHMLVALDYEKYVITSEKVERARCKTANREEGYRRKEERKSFSLFSPRVSILVGGHISLALVSQLIRHDADRSPNGIMLYKVILAFE